MSYYDYLRLNYVQKDNNIVIDELEDLIRDMSLYGHLIGYTLSNND